MKHASMASRLMLVALLASLGSVSAYAERGGRHGGHDRFDDHRYEDRYRADDRGRHPGPYRNDYWQERDVRFHDDMRVRIDVYYDSRFRRGSCPQGLSRRGNVCVPVGHARHWERGRPLPRNVVYTPLPPALLVQLPPPPPHHEYVRVASDVLLIATGTAMVIDAIEDIGRRR